jgi:hypothetical protein
VLLTRRRFVKLVGAGAAIASVPWAAGCGDDLPPPPRGRFFDEPQWATIDAATEQVLPGASAAMAVRYIDRLLGAFDVSPPTIFAGGPASGRTPLPTATGAPSANFPADAFEAFLPLSRVRAIAWRMRIFGSRATHGGDFNDAIVGPTRGWRDIYAAGIAALDDAAALIAHGARFVDLADADRLTALSDADGAVPGFADLLAAHTIEGVFAAPEYGGNADLRGWQLARWDGDSVPLGHAFYDPAAGVYRDRADQPTSAPTPGDTVEDFDPDVIQLLTIAALGSGGMKFG